MSNENVTAKASGNTEVQNKVIHQVGRHSGDKRDTLRNATFLANRYEGTGTVISIGSTF